MVVLDTAVIASAAVVFSIESEMLGVGVQITVSED